MKARVPTFHLFRSSSYRNHRFIHASMRRKVIANHVAVLHHESNAF